MCLEAPQNRQRLLLRQCCHSLGESTELTVRTELRGNVRVGLLGLGSLSFVLGSARVTRSDVGFFCRSFPVMGVNGQGKFMEC